MYYRLLFSLRAAIVNADSVSVGSSSEEESMSGDVGLNGTDCTDEGTSDCTVDCTDTGENNSVRSRVGRSSGISGDVGLYGDSINFLGSCAGLRRPV